tara:strand:- start:383 stop:634 length:252 start_codon:yes stop_codon:yes gene_type:complete
MSSLFANFSAGGFSADLLITSFVFWIYMFNKIKDGQPKHYVFIILNLTIGLSCALPAYFYWIEKIKNNRINNIKKIIMTVGSW